LRVSYVGVSEDIIDTPPQGQRERNSVELASKEGKMGSGEGLVKMSTSWSRLDKKWILSVLEATTYEQSESQFPRVFY
jgi:hypothetical protein